MKKEISIFWFRRDLRIDDNKGLYNALKENEYFVDEQRFGPYSLWHHKHFIKKINGGIEMEDIVDYKIPFGILGQIAHPLFVKNKLRQIFKFREKKLIKLFGKL